MLKDAHAGSIFPAPIEHSSYAFARFKGPFASSTLQSNVKLGSLLTVATLSVAMIASDRFIRLVKMQLDRS